MVRTAKTEFFSRSCLLPLYSSFLFLFFGCFWLVNCLCKWSQKIGIRCHAAVIKNLSNDADILAFANAKKQHNLSEIYRMHFWKVNFGKLEVVNFGKSDRFKGFPDAWFYFGNFVKSELFGLFCRHGNNSLVWCYNPECCTGSCWNYRGYLWRA